MDPDTVIALGSLVHDLLGLVGGIILCYFGYRLMMRRIKAYPAADRKWSWNTAKIVFKNTAPGTMFALLGSIAIWLTAAKGLHSEGPGYVTVTSNTGNLVARKTTEDAPIVMTLGAGGAVPVRSSQNSVPESPSNSAATSGVVNASGIASAKITPARKPGGVMAAAGETASGTKQGVDSVTNVRARIAHKNLEKQRLAAERKRSRLEAMYQKGTISADAYKSGEDEYRIAIQRYRSEVNAVRLDEN
jgi:hypothetical protein